MANTFGGGVLKGILGQQELRQNKMALDRQNQLLGISLIKDLNNTQASIDLTRRKKQYASDSANAFQDIFTDVDQAGNRVMKNLTDEDHIKGTMQFRFNQMYSAMQNGLITDDEQKKAFAEVGQLRKMGVENLIQQMILRPTDMAVQEKLKNKFGLKGEVAFASKFDSNTGEPKFVALFPDPNNPTNNNFTERDLTPYLQSIALVSLNELQDASKKKLERKEISGKVDKLGAETDKLEAQTKIIPAESKSKIAEQDSKRIRNLAQASNIVNKPLKEFDPKKIFSSRSTIGKPSVMPNGANYLASLERGAVGYGAKFTTARKWGLDNLEKLKGIIAQNKIPEEWASNPSNAKKVQDFAEDGIDVPEDVIAHLKQGLPLSAEANAKIKTLMTNSDYNKIENKLMGIYLPRYLNSREIQQELKSIGEIDREIIDKTLKGINPYATDDQ